MGRRQVAIWFRWLRRSPFAGVSANESRKATTLQWVVIAILTAIGVGVCAFFIMTIAASRIRVPQSAISSRKSAYIVMGILFVVWVCGIPVSVGFQAAAAFSVFQVTAGRDATLGHRVELFLTSAEGTGGLLSIAGSMQPMKTHQMPLLLAAP